jgi:hypothetical protein
LDRLNQAKMFGQLFEQTVLHAGDISIDAGPTRRVLQYDVFMPPILPSIHQQVFTAHSLYTINRFALCCLNLP